MRVLVVGAGGREHALAWRLATSPSVAAVETAPGNAGTAQLGPTHPIDVDDHDAVAELVRRRRIDLVVIGPEAPLVAGLADALRACGVAVFGPSAAAARIEGSKAFAKQVMAAAGVPTARAVEATDVATADAALERFTPPYVVKADGLAAGKGVRICADLAEAREAVRDALEQDRFGAAGRRLVIEEFLAGREASVFAMACGTDAWLLPAARDYKRALDGDRGPNTGGMGAYTPVEDLPEEALGDIAARIVRPVLAELADRGAPYQGLLYAGLVLTADGPKVLEFNCRFGDPETQVVVPRITADLGVLLRAVAEGSPPPVPLTWTPDAFVTVVLASGGYPGPYRTGLPISGVEAAAARPDALVFHAGTRRDEDGVLRTAGGRVLAVTGRGPTVAEARAAAYAAADLISFEGLHRRDDIAAGVGSAPPTPAAGHGPASTRSDRRTWRRRW